MEWTNFNIYKGVIGISVPNQKNIKINKCSKDERNSPHFLQVNAAQWEEAYRLTGRSKVAFALWLYLANNQDGYSLDFSPQDFINKINVSRSSVYDAVKMLRELGYINDNGGRYEIFSTWP